METASWKRAGGVGSACSGFKRVWSEVEGVTACCGEMGCCVDMATLSKSNFRSKTVGGCGDAEGRRRTNSDDKRVSYVVKVKQALLQMSSFCVAHSSS